MSLKRPCVSLAFRASLSLCHLYFLSILCCAGSEPLLPDGRSKADCAMAETIAKTVLPADPKERRTALNAMLKPLVDRAVAACGEARQTALRSDEAGAKLAGAQIEGGYWLKPLEDAADHWAVESAWLQVTAYEAAQAAHGAGRAIEFAKRGESWRPSNIDEDVDALIAAQRALAR